MSLDRGTTSFSLSIDDMGEIEGATGGLQPPDDALVVAADRPATSKDVPTDSGRPATTGAAATPVRPDSSMSQESIDSILKRKLQRKLTAK